MSEGNDREDFYAGMLVGWCCAVIVFGICGVFAAKGNEQKVWREWSCAQAHASLVDTMCVRPDTSYRVPGPSK